MREIRLFKSLCPPPFERPLYSRTVTPGMTGVTSQGDEEVVNHRRRATAGGHIAITSRQRSVIETRKHLAVLLCVLRAPRRPAGPSGPYVA